MKILKVDLKRAFFSKTNLITILIGLLVILLGMFMEPIRSAFNLYYSNASDINNSQKMHLIKNSLNKATLWNFGNYYYIMLMPLLSSIPFASAYLEDKKTGFNKFQIIRTNYKKYILSKLITTFISGFSVILIISIIYFLGINLIDSGNEFRSIFYDNTFLGDLGRLNFNLFLVIYTIITSFMGGVYAVFGLAISTFVNSILIGIVSPFILYYFGSYLFLIIGKVEYSPNIVNEFYRYVGISFKNIFIQLIVIFILSTICFFIKTYRSDTFK